MQIKIIQIILIQMFYSIVLKVIKRYWEPIRQGHQELSESTTFFRVEINIELEGANLGS